MQATRERILSILKERGQVTVDELSQELGLTTVTVRHHLDILRGEGLIAAPAVQRSKSPGRPRHVYALSEKAAVLFPKRYDHLIGQILDEMRARLSPAEMEQIMARIGERIAGQATLPNTDDFGARLAAVVSFLEALGYMPQLERDADGGYLLHITNCPYERVSQHHAICRVDLAMLTQLLGAEPQHVASVAQGDPQCTYVVQIHQD